MNRPRTVWTLIFLCILSLAATAVEADEFRGLWADAWHEGFFNTSQINALVDKAYNNNFNAIIMQVRRRGDAYYIPTYPNTEPRNITSFDPLGYMIQKAHAKGLEVHTWVTTYPVTSSVSENRSTHVVNRHPEWLMQNYAGAVDFGEGRYLDPGVPDAAIWNYNVFMDLVKNYDIDGIHFDYIRYPGSDSGYNPIAIARFNEECNRTGKPGSTDATFSNWRRKQVTDFVKMVYLNAIDEKPGIKVSASTFANRYDAYTYRFQDWASWMSMGILDANTPMNYTSSNSTYNSRSNDAVAHKGSRHVYMGPGASHDNLITQVQYSLNNGCDGVQIYSYYLLDLRSHHYTGLTNGPFAAKANCPIMPWKASPTQGYIKGNVTMQGQRLSNATLTILPYSGTTQSSGTGFYGFSQITPGQYSIQCSAVGARTQTGNVTVQAGKVATLDFDLPVGDTPTPTPTRTPWPTDVPYVVIVDDNDTTGFLTTGRWDRKIRTGGHGPTYCVTYLSVQGDYAEYRPNLLKAGDYKVSVCYLGGDKRASDVPYRVYYSGGWQNFLVDQRINSGQWNLLGTFPFQEGTSGYVGQWDNVTTGEVVVADAVKFEYIPPPATATPTPSPTPIYVDGNYILFKGE